jgi:hypothetical protein
LDYDVFVLRAIGLLAFIALSFPAWAETLVTRANIAEIDGTSIVLEIGTEAVPARLDKATKFWKAKKPADLDGFAKGDAVAVRLKTDADPPVVREIADPATYEWLTLIRKEPVRAEVVKVDAKQVVVALDADTRFVYRHSENSKVSVGGENLKVTDLTEGQKLYFKGRLLPTLDTWLVLATDKRPAGSEPEPTEVPRYRPARTGKLEGLVDGHHPLYWKVDLYIGDKLMHVTYTRETQIKLDGRKAQPRHIERGLRIRATYRRDQFGRLIASKIELFHSSASLF